MKTIYANGVVASRETWAAVEAIPGVVTRRGRLGIPENAIVAAARVAQSYGEVIQWDPASRDLVRSAMAPPPLAVDGALIGLKPGIEAWLTEYQREGIAWARARPGTMLLWAAGCLAGDAEIVINRRGCARRITLRELVYKFNSGVTETALPGGGVSRKRWRLEFPTFAQSRADDGTLMLNRIVAAVASGPKPTYTVTLFNGMTLRATADHRVLTQRGWVRAGDLQIGSDSVWHNAGQSGGGDCARKAYYPQQGGMHHHPFAVHGVRQRAGQPGRTGVRGGTGEQRSARVPKHRVSMEAAISGLSYAAFVRRVRDGQLDGLTFLDPAEFAVHHRDENPANWAPENLVVQTHSDHHRDHALAGKWRHVAYKTALSPVRSVVYHGEEETFDLTMEQPFDNFVANGMVVHNSGKSIGAIVAAQQHPGGVVVIVTLAGIKRHWRAEVDHVCHADRAWVIDGEDTSEPIPEGYRFLIVSWEILPAWADRLAALPVRMVIFDESHRTKGSRSAKPGATGGKWGAAAQAIAAGADRVLCLTATPIPDRPRDLWAQLHLMARWSVGGFWVYAKRYCNAFEGQYGWDTTGSSNQPELRDRLRFHAHVVSKDRSHRALPPLRRTVAYIPKGELLADRLPKADRKAATEGPPKTMMEVQLAGAARRKRRQVVDLVEGALFPKGKVIVFTGRHADVEDLAEAIRKMAGDAVTVWAVHGGNSTGADRERIAGLKRPDGTYPADSYMGHSGPCVLVATADTMGTGVNLQDTDLLIMAMLPYSPGQVIQRENRVHRLGGTRRPQVVYLVAEGTIDEKVAGALLEKLPAVGAITGDLEASAIAESLEGLGDEEELAAGLLANTVRPAGQLALLGGE